MSQYTIGIDVGGTNIKLGLVNRLGVITSRSSLNTKLFHKNKTKMINALVEEIKGLISKKKLTVKHILGVGIGLPGLIDSKRGIVGFLPNVPGWRNVPLKKILQKKLRVPVFIDNDVNLVALGEWTFGAGKGFRNLLCLTLGTGVGAGLILNNELYRGEGFVAGELGHVPLNEQGPKCACGGWGCFERYVGNADLMKKASKIFKTKNIQPTDVFAMANRGNKRAIAFWKDAANHMGNGLVGVVNLLNPQLIVIGGGISNSYKYLGKTIKSVIKKRAMQVQAKMVNIVRAKLGDDAGIIGAHVLVKDALLER